MPAGRSRGDSRPRFLERSCHEHVNHYQHRKSEWKQFCKKRLQGSKRVEGNHCMEPSTPSKPAPERPSQVLRRIFRATPKSASFATPRQIITFADLRSQWTTGWCKPSCKNSSPRATSRAIEWAPSNAIGRPRFPHIRKWLARQPPSPNSITTCSCPQVLLKLPNNAMMFGWRISASSLNSRSKLSSKFGSTSAASGVSDFIATHMPSQEPFRTTPNDPDPRMSSLLKATSDSTIHGCVCEADAPISKHHFDLMYAMHDSRLIALDIVYKRSFLSRLLDQRNLFRVIAALNSVSCCFVRFCIFPQIFISSNNKQNRMLQT